jgi:hypothetical protein
MGELVGPWVVTAGEGGCRILVADRRGNSNLIRVIQPGERCEIFMTPVKRRKV